MIGLMIVICVFYCVIISKNNVEYSYIKTINIIKYISIKGIVNIINF